jgi:hypothetical protein
MTRRFVPSCGALRRYTARRELLRIGALALGGLSTPALRAARAAATPPAAPRSFGRARRALLLFMWGGPAQMDTWDPKPDAAAEYRGEFRPISTDVPGIQICEHFPLLARRCRDLAIVRSVHHPDVNHLTATHYLLTGEAMPSPQGTPAEDWPHLGAVLAGLGRGHPAMPPYVALRPRTGLDVPRFVEESRGQGSGWLGPSYQPLVIDNDPAGREYHAGEYSLNAELRGHRFERRLRLYDQLGDRLRGLERDAAVAAYTAGYARARNLLAEAGAGAAFDLSREPDALRDRYGRHIHGQAVLQARRLLEAGVPLVTVFWQNDGLKNVSVYWDTHSRNFVDLRERLMPPADQAFSALLDDLRERGMLEDTVILWTGEFGRTPRVGQAVEGGAGAGRDGRDHWPHVFSCVLAGGGIRGGQVHGRSDSVAAYPEEDGVTPADVLATVYHCLGIAPHTMLRDPQARPLPVTSGTPIRTLI